MTTIQPIPDQSETILRDLMQVLIDGQKGFAKAAESLEEDGHSDLAEMMNQCAEQLQRLASELREAASSYVACPMSRVRPRPTFIVPGWAWPTLSPATTLMRFSPLPTKARITPKKAYSDTLREDLPEDLRTVVQRQADEVREVHDQVRDLRDQHGG